MGVFRFYEVTTIYQLGMCRLDINKIELDINKIDINKTLLDINKIEFLALG